MTELPSLFYISECSLSDALMELDYGPAISHCYDPVVYARTAHEKYLQLFLGNQSTPIMILGMNPGPWGMAQTGVPFGEISTVRNWLNINEPVAKPLNEHPKRIVTGFSCNRSEVSGERLWSLLRTLSSDNLSSLSRSVFVHNYCPILMLGGKNGKNITPAELKAKERRPLEQLCDSHLSHQVRLLGIKHILAVGNYSYQRSVKALTNTPECKIYKISHPSQRNRLSSNNWIENSITAIKDYGLLQYFPLYQNQQT